MPPLEPSSNLPGGVHHSVTLPSNDGQELKGPSQNNTSTSVCVTPHPPSPLSSPLPPRRETASDQGPSFRALNLELQGPSFRTLPSALPLCQPFAEARDASRATYMGKA